MAKTTIYENYRGYTYFKLNNGQLLLSGTKEGDKLFDTLQDMKDFVDVQIDGPKPCEYCKAGPDKKTVKFKKNSRYGYKIYSNGLVVGCAECEDMAFLPAKFCPMCGRKL